jgi:hypothetical protein
LSSNAGYFQADNVEANDTCMLYLLYLLYPSESLILVDKRHLKQRVRCIGHVVNLVAQAFLEGNNKKRLRSLTEGTCEYRNAAEDNQQLGHWRSSGSLGKPHNVVKFVRADPKRRTEIIEIIRGGITEEELDEFGFLPRNTPACSLNRITPRGGTWYIR